jgi:tetratricopeptide (TPR) repeat protein
VKAKDSPLRPSRRARRLGAKCHRPVVPRREPAPEAAPEPSGAAGADGAATLLAIAKEDRELAAELMRMPPVERIAAASCDPRFRRPTLVRLLALETEAALDDLARDPRPAAELGAALAEALPRDDQGKARRATAWAWWLFGKSLLRASQWRLARSAFDAMYAFAPDQPSEEAALCAVGLAQVWEDAGQVEAAETLFMIAGHAYSKLHATTPAAGCHAQLGFILYETGDLVNAAGWLRNAVVSLDPASAPSLAARMWLTLAEIETTLDDSVAAAESLHRARALYPLARFASEALDQRWREARIAIAAGEDARADSLLERVRPELLARGSLSETARCTFEQLLVRIEGGRFESAGELTSAFAGAFPRVEELAAEMAALTRLAADRPPAGVFPQLHLCAEWSLRTAPPSFRIRAPTARSSRPRRGLPFLPGAANMQPGGCI